MSAEGSLLLNRVFSRNTLRDILNHSFSSTYSEAVRHYVRDYEDKDNGQLLSHIYALLRKQYRNEYYYKNTILNKLLLGVHKPTTATALTEVAVGRSKADFVLINGQATVYEIKTELDNLDRLEAQLTDYFKAFTRVSVLTSEGHLPALDKCLEHSPAGISVLTGKGTIRKIREPREYTEGLDKDAMFRILRKAEYEDILARLHGGSPNVSQFDYYKTCKHLYCQMETSSAHSEFVSALKKRSRIDTDLYNQVPYELKYLVYFSGFKPGDYARLHSFLQQKEAVRCTSHILEVGNLN